MAAGAPPLPALVETAAAGEPAEPDAVLAREPAADEPLLVMPGAVVVPPLPAAAAEPPVPL
jgi:hypothetical protein